MTSAANRHDCEYRIEADKAMRDYDDLELEFGVMRDRLTVDRARAYWIGATVGLILGAALGWLVTFGAMR